MHTRRTWHFGRSVPLWTHLLAWATASLCFLGVLATGVLGAKGTVVFDDYASGLAPAIAAAFCLRTARRADGRLRRAWLLLGSALVSWAAGTAVWTVYEVHLGDEIPFPSLADVGYLASVPLGLAAMLTFPGARVHGLARLRPVLDGVIVAGALLFVSWATVLGPVFHANAGTLLAQVISLAYPGGDLLSATVAVLTVARARGPLRVTMSLIAAGMMTVVVGDSAFAWFTARGDYATGNLFDTGYLAGFLLIGLAALRANPLEPAPASAGESDDSAIAPNRLALALPYVPLMLSLPFAVLMKLHGQPIGPLLFCVGVVVILAILLRQLLTMQTNMALSQELRDTVGELRSREAQLSHQAFHDPLTGLANRALFGDRLGHALAQKRRPGPVILLLADLDEFKAVNDTLGHPAGDALLIAVAERLRAVVRPEDTVARLGGDEFAVLLESREGLVAGHRVAHRIEEALVAPFHLSGVQTVIGASIGIAAGDPSATGETMLRDADIAMYAAKAGGKGRAEVFAVDLAVANIDRLRLKGDFSEALARDELHLKYQPIIDLSTGQLRGVEALLRWTHPDGDDVPPSVFIPLAEASGAILPIGRWVLAEACAQAGRWQQDQPDGLPPLQLAVNLSGRQLEDPQLMPAVRAALTASGLHPSLLTLEITESVLFEEDENTMARLTALRALGVRLAIDDFGTGQSSLSRLRRYPIDTLKIDRSFIAALTPSAPVPDVVITAILALGEGLGMNVIAEGVETEEQLVALRGLECPQAQGFLFARPAHPDVIGELIRAGITLADPPTITFPGSVA
jgi:diguanylate cyclase (GGDEF)-like protein